MILTHVLCASDTSHCSCHVSCLYECDACLYSSCGRLFIVYLAVSICYPSVFLLLHSLFFCSHLCFTHSRYAASACICLYLRTGMHIKKFPIVRATTVRCLYAYLVCVHGACLFDFRWFEYSVPISVFRPSMSRDFPVCVGVFSYLD